MSADVIWVEETSELAVMVAMLWWFSKSSSPLVADQGTGGVSCDVFGF